MINFDCGQLEMICLPKKVAEELIGAPSACLKLYIYILMRKKADIPLMSEEMNMPAAQIDEAMTLLREKGFIKQDGAERIRLVLPEEEEEEVSIYSNAKNTATLQALFSDRILSSQDYSAIRECTTVYGLPEEVVIRLVEHCITTNKAKNRVSMAYIHRKAAEWSEEGIDTIELAEKRANMERSDNQNLKELLMRLGMRGRHATSEEKKLFAKWTMEYGLDMDAVFAVLPATLSAHTPTLKYMDSIITKMYNQGKTSAAGISETLEDTAAVDKHVKELLECIGALRHTVTDEMRKMYTRFMSMGFSNEAILLAGKRAMLEGCPTLKNVDMILSGWSSRGAIALEDIEIMLKRSEEAKLRAKEYMKRMGVTKPVADKDIALINRYMAKGMSEDTILFAAELAYGASSPAKLAQTILKSWSTAGIKTLEDAKRENEKHKFTPNRASNEREYTKDDIKNKLRDPLEEF